MSAAEARHQRRLLDRLLRASCDDGGHAGDLVRRLNACSLKDPCGSGACPVCWRAMRCLVLHASRDLFREPGRYQYVTCIRAPDLVAHGRLQASDPLREVEHHLMRIARDGRSRVFGGLDISSNEHRQQNFRPHYMPHGHVLVSTDRYDEEIWKQHFPGHHLVAKPVEAKHFDGRRRAIAYCLHPIVERRDSEAAHDTPDGTHKRANTRDKPLRTPQRLELALMLDRVGIEARIITHGYELVIDGNDVQMVPVELPRANELLVERQRRRAAHRDEYRRREREHAAQGGIQQTWL